MTFDLSRIKRSSGSGVTGREIGFNNLMPLGPINMGNPATSLGRAIKDAITPPQIPHKSIAVWPPEVKLGNPDGSNESTDTHPSKEAAEAVCSLLRKHGFGGEGKYFPISTRVEPIVS